MTYQGTIAGQGTVIKLTKVVEGHDGPITQITLREPVFGDWVACGEMHRQIVMKPENIDESKVLVEIDVEAVAKWFQRLSGLPMAVLAQLSYADSKVIFNHVTKVVGGPNDAKK